MSADKKTGKIPTNDSEPLVQNIFASLPDTALQNLKTAAAAPATLTATPAPTSAPTLAPKSTPAKNRGRVDIAREKNGRGGKTVTIVRNFVGIGLPEKEALAKKMRAACGTGGTVKDGCIEIQGDKRDEIARILTEAGFRPVFAGG